jgi:uncharacterized membrane protein YphA (DoxX/SURF4 family)
MQAIDKMNRWTNAHDRGYLVDIVRVVFGIFLFYKGVQFGRDPELAANLIWPSSQFAVPMAVSHLVVITHLSGGLLLVFGLLTRIVTAILWPILLMAVVVSFVDGLAAATLISALAGLFLCTAFLVLGPGKGSADKSLHMHM